MNSPLHIVSCNFSIVVIVIMRNNLVHLCHCQNCQLITVLMCLLFTVLRGNTTSQSTQVNNSLKDVDVSDVNES